MAASSPAFADDTATLIPPNCAAPPVLSAVDAALGICHSPDELRTYLAAMRLYMPAPHRAYLRAVELGPSIRDYVTERRESAGLRAAYDEAENDDGEAGARPGEKGPLVGSVVRIVAYHGFEPAKQAIGFAACS